MKWKHRNSSIYLCLALIATPTAIVHSLSRSDAPAFLHILAKCRYNYREVKGTRAAALPVFGEDEVLRTAATYASPISTADCCTTISCRDLDQAQSRLCSPAPESFDILDETIRQALVGADDFENVRIMDVEAVAAQIVKPGCHVGISIDPKEGESVVEWWIERRTVQSLGGPFVNRSTILYIDSSDWIEKPPGVLDLAHLALKLRTDSSIRGVDPARDIEKVVGDAKKRLDLLKGADLRGRTSADAAFCFALAGVKCETLFETLGDVAIKELARFGTRASCKPNHICHMVEKLAASGIQREDILKISSQILRDKNHEDLSSNLSGEHFGFFSYMPLLWLWRFSTKQSKVIPAQFFAADEKKHDWQQLFKDPSRPLVIDLGSGMGISLLGLATSSHTKSDVIDIDWSSCNFLGVELNPTLVGFGRGMASRWGLTDVLQFTSTPAEVLIESVIKTYPGETEMVMIQFPTPFRLEADDRTTDIEGMGNPQLPKKSNFMVTPNLLNGIRRALKGERGYLLIQSNSEDVAVHMKDQAENIASFSSVNVPFPVLNDQDISGRLSWRTKRMLEHGGQRAHGSAWSKESLLPFKSETEVSCMLNDTPIHRCVLKGKV